MATMSNTVVTTKVLIVEDDPDAAGRGGGGGAGRGRPHPSLDTRRV